MATRFWKQIRQNYTVEKRKKRLGFYEKPDEILSNLENFSIKENTLDIKGWIFPAIGKLEEVCIQFSDKINHCRYEIQYGMRRLDVASVFENKNGENSGFSFQCDCQSGTYDIEVFLCFWWNGTPYGWKLGVIPGKGEQKTGEPVCFDVQNRTEFVLDVFEENIQSIHIEKSIPKYRNIHVIVRINEDCSEATKLEKFFRADYRVKSVTLWRENEVSEEDIVKILQRKAFVLLVDEKLEIPQGLLDRLLYSYEKYADLYRIGMISAMVLDKKEKTIMDTTGKYGKYSCGIQENSGEDRCVLFGPHKLKRERSKTIAQYKDCLKRHGYQAVITELAFVYGTCPDSKIFMNQYLYIHRYKQEREKLCALAICHEIGGGAQKFIEEKKKNWISEGNISVFIFFRILEGTYRIVIEEKKNSITFTVQNWDRISLLFEIFHIQKIWVNELVTYLYTYEKLNSLIEWKKKFESELIFYFHDYYAFCPRFTLMNMEDRYCGLPPVAECQMCAESVLRNLGEGYGSIISWREKWKLFLVETDAVIVFSENTRELIEQVWGKMDNISLQPHAVGYLRKVKPHSNMDSILRIGVLGTLNRHKGSGIIGEMCGLIELQKLPIEITIIGTCKELSGNAILKITGSYEREHLPEIIEDRKIDVIFIPSIWPETFSYTSQEAIEMGMPVAVFDLGAPPERVKKYEKGLVIDKIDAAYALEKIRGMVI